MPQEVNSPVRGLRIERRLCDNCKRLPVSIDIDFIDGLCEALCVQCCREKHPHIAQMAGLERHD